MKPIFIGAGALAVLLLAAAGVFVFVGGGEPAGAVAPKVQPATTAAPKPVATLASDRGDMARLKQENALLKEQLDNMRAELAKTQQAALAEAAKDEKAPTTEELDAKEFWGDVKEATDSAKDEKKAERDRRRGQFSEERVQQFRQAMDQFYDDAIAQGGPQEVQDRIQALRDYSNQMMDLRQQIRSAEDPKAQDALRQQLDQVRDELKPLVRDQQDYMLRQAAENSGVTDPKVQQQLVNSVRDTIKSPFFTQTNRGPGGPGGQGGRGPGGPPGP